MRIDTDMGCESVDAGSPDAAREGPQANHALRGCKVSCAPLENALTFREELDIRMQYTRVLSAISVIKHQ